MSFIQKETIKQELFQHALQTTRKKKFIMAMVHYTLNPNDKPTPEMLAELERASKMPITYDEDCPELTEAQLERVRKIAATRRRPSYTVVLSDFSTNYMAQFGEKAPFIISRLVDEAIRNPELIQKCL